MPVCPRGNRDGFGGINDAAAADRHNRFGVTGRQQRSTRIDGRNRGVGGHPLKHLYECTRLFERTLHLAQ